MFTPMTATLDEQETVSQILREARDDQAVQRRLDQLMEEQNHLPRQDYAKLHERIRANLSHQRIKQHWLESGGADSPVGLPKDPVFPMQHEDGHYMVEFRGGDIRIRDNGQGLVLNATRRVAVVFEGFGLEIRQESGDEIYGTLSCKVAGTEYRQDFVLPEVQLGPEDNNRISQPGLVLYEGPPTSLNILLALVEHDDGPRDEIREATRQRFRQVLETAGETVAAGLPGDAASIVSSVTRKEAVASGDLFEWLANAAADLIFEVLGMGDDPYTTVGLTITAAEMENPPPVMEYRCWADPRVLPYTHARTTLSRDDGGDTGQITAVFRVERR
jgi:hypothetical protein